MLLNRPVGSQAVLNILTMFLNIINSKFVFAYVIMKLLRENTKLEITSTKPLLKQATWSSFLCPV